MLNRNILKRALTGAAVAATAMLVACQATQPTVKDYSAFRAENPQSILVLPALNNSGSVSSSSSPPRSRILPVHDFPAICPARILCVPGKHGEVLAGRGGTCRSLAAL